MGIRKTLAAAALVFAFAFVVTTPASATTFCVPAYSATCPNAGANVAQPNLQTALNTNMSDGAPDRVILTAPAYVHGPSRIDVLGSDRLTVAGAGPDKSSITTTQTSADYVINMFASDREIVFKDLKIIAPESQAGGGSAVFAQGDTFENVDIEVRNPGTEFAVNFTGGGSYTGGKIYTSGAGTLNTGVITSGASPGPLDLERVSIIGAGRGVDSGSDLQKVTFRRGSILGASDHAALSTHGGDLRIENSVIQSTGAQSAIYLQGQEDTKKTTIEVESSTVVAPGSVKPAIRSEVLNQAQNRSVYVDVRNSIIRGFDSTFELSSPTAKADVGDNHLTIEHSNFNLFGTETGDGTVYLAPDNINQDPLFMSPATGDYSLSKNSPSVDAGDPAAILPAIDILGRTRPIDGDEDGTVVRDQGAFEYVPDHKGPPPGCDTVPALCPDKTAPKISKVKVRKGSVKLTLSEAARIKVTLKPMPVGKRKQVKLSKAGKAGANTLKFRKGRLKPGKYRVTITATDAAGNKSRAVKRSLKIKQ